MAEVVLATHNPGKLREFQALLQAAPFSIIPYPSEQEIIEETGSTYLENARLKARFVAQSMNMPALADDSGVEVDALDGLPGIHSARFVSAVPWENSREILLRLMNVPPENRTARMRAVLVLAWPDGREVSAEGILEGRILSWPRGRNGFGVDPIFTVDGKHSLAQLPPDQKNELSHRTKATQALLQILTNVRL